MYWFTCSRLQLSYHCTVLEDTDQEISSPEHCQMMEVVTDNRQKKAFYVIKPYISYFEIERKILSF